MTKQMHDTTTISQEVNRLLAGKDFGVLSTTSKHLQGTPFGSVANYCLDRQGDILLYFSTIAEHTHNLIDDPRASLTVLAAAGGNVQAEARITVSGHVSEFTEGLEEAMARYFRYFPEAEMYSEFHDFALYRLKAESYRYIGGFGKIHWVEPSEVQVPHPLSLQEEAYVLQHMNEDHQHNMRHYLKAHGAVEESAADSIRLIGLHRDYMDLLCDGRKVSIPLLREVTDAGSARAVLVEMAK